MLISDHEIWNADVQPKAMSKQTSKSKFCTSKLKDRNLWLVKI